MAFFNYVTKEITLKVVYYGPGLSGKTTNLHHLYTVLDPSNRGKFISLATESDRTLFFDFLPVDLGKIKEFAVRFQLYTVPGQIRYNATRKLVLKGADAVVFVADSQRDLRDQNIESFANMKENLLANNINPDDIPVVVQYNKRDLPNILSLEDLRRDINRGGHRDIEAVASEGKGVQETFRLITKELLKDIAQKHKVDIAPSKEETSLVEPVYVEAQVPGAPLPLETPLEALSVSAAPLQPQPRAATLSEEKLNALIDGIDEIKGSLTGLRATLSVLISDVKESKRQQADISKRLHDLNDALLQGKRKRRWFRLSS